MIQFLIKYAIFVAVVFLLLYLIIYIFKLSSYIEDKKKGYSLSKIRQFSEADKNYINYLMEKPLFPLITKEEVEEAMVIIKIGRECDAKTAMNRLYEYINKSSASKGRKLTFFVSTVELMEENKILNREEELKIMKEYVDKN